MCTMMPITSYTAASNIVESSALLLSLESVSHKVFIPYSSRGFSVDQLKGNNFRQRYNQML